MAFGDLYGYRTNVTDVVAFAEGDEVQEENPAWDDDGAQTDPDADGDPRYFNYVDLVLTGQSSGTARRSRVPVEAEADAGPNQAFAVV